jgi:SAM-dependent methyltransferase
MAQRSKHGPDKPRDSSHAHPHAHEPGHAQGHTHGDGHKHGHKHGHGTGLKFDPARLERLRDPARLARQNPEVLWAVVSAGLKVRAVVDLGAGIGFFALPIARHLPGGTVYACDVSPDMLHYLEEAIREAGATNVKAVQTGEVKVPLEDGIADVLLLMLVYHELDWRDQTLAECHRLLRPGGRLAVADWKREKTESGPPLEIRFDPAEVRAELEAAGFHDVQEHAIMPEHWCLTALK